MLILDHVPTPSEAVQIIADGIDEVRFPFATETMVEAYATALSASRELLVAAGVRFGVSNLTVEF